MQQRIRGKARGIGMAVVALAALAGAEARASVVLTFELIKPDNGNTDVSSLLAVQVDDTGMGAKFTILNNGTAGQFKIAQVAFDDSDAMAILTGATSEPTITQTAPTEFVKDDMPNLPNGNNASPPFDADYGIIKKGNGELDAGGTLMVEYAYSAGKDFSALLAAIQDGSFRVGMHVIGIQPQGGSDSYVSTGVIPEPSTFVLAGLGLGIVGLASRRRRKA